MIKLRTVLFTCACIFTKSVFAAPMIPITMTITGDVSSISEDDFCSLLGKSEGMCSSIPGYAIMLKNVDYEVIAGPDFPDYEKGIVHHKDSLLIYTTDTIFRSLIGKTVSISKYNLRGDEFSMGSTIESIKITSAITINKKSHVDTGDKTMLVITAGGMVRVSGFPVGKIWNLKILDMAGRTVITLNGGTQGTSSEVKIDKLQPGVYFYQLQAGDLFETQTVRIVN